MSGRLDGARILLTRPEDDSRDLARRLRDAGAETLCTPMIRIVPAPDDTGLRHARSGIAGFDRIVLTSRHAVRALLEGLLPVSGPRIAVVGESTAQAVVSMGWPVDHVSSGKGGAALAEELAGDGVAGEKILYPTSNLSRDVVSKRLREAGADVTVVEAYRTAAPAQDDTGVRGMMLEVASGKIDIAVFGSPSATRNFARLCPGASIPAGLATVAIGETTAHEVRNCGGGNVTTAERPDAEGLFAAVAASWSGLIKGRSQT